MAIARRRGDISILTSKAPITSKKTDTNMLVSKVITVSKKIDIDNVDVNIGQ